jgi:hypothetical protein
MENKIDDLEAVRILVETLKGFDNNEQERIIRWATEKLGIKYTHYNQPTSNVNQESTQNNIAKNAPNKDFKSFYNEKKPTSDMQFAATVAYYYQFEAPESEKQHAINGDALQNAARLAGRERLKNPTKTLNNACINGMLDNTDEKGVYKINTVGENLVAMALPQEGKTKKKKETKASKKNTKKKK